MLGSYINPQEKVVVSLTCFYFVVVAFRCVGLRPGAAVHSRGHQAPVLHELLHGGDEDRLETQVRSPLSRRPYMWPVVWRSVLGFNALFLCGEGRVRSPPPRRWGSAARQRWPGCRSAIRPTRRRVTTPSRSQTACRPTPEPSTFQGKVTSL